MAEQPDDVEYIWIVDWVGGHTSYYAGPRGDWFVEDLRNVYDEEFELRIWFW